MTTIRINVYDLLNTGALKLIGLGLHHTGVQIGDYSEYEFGNGYGITIIPPKTATNATFSHSIDAGTIHIHDVSLALSEMYAEFTCDNYDILSRNCNHFTEHFVYRPLKISIRTECAD